jgi:hypothetical protein
MRRTQPGDAETVAQRVGQHASRRGADQRERLQVELMERAAGPSPIMMSIWQSSAG